MENYFSLTIHQRINERQYTYNRNSPKSSKERRIDVWETIKTHLVNHRQAVQTTNFEMSREIKFRAYDSDLKIILTQESSALRNWQILERYWKIDQYTGFKDSKGNEIYEGDIMKICATGNMIDAIEVVVVYKFACFIVEHKGNTVHSLSHIVKYFPIFEIIGNIHQTTTEHQQALKVQLIEKHKIEVVEFSFLSKILYDYPKPYEKKLYLSDGGHFFLAVDNTGGQAYAEEFNHKRNAILWLIGEKEIDNGYAETETNCKGCFGSCGRCEEKEVGNE